jgi:hypothetical protein
MPGTIFLGHLLFAAALAALLAAVALVLKAWRNRGYERGTPQYANERLMRRYAVYALVVAVLLGALCLTPLCNVPLVEIG